MRHPVRKQPWKLKKFEAKNFTTLIYGCDSFKVLISSLQTNPSFKKHTSMKSHFSCYCNVLFHMTHLKEQAFDKLKVKSTISFDTLPSKAKKKWLLVASEDFVCSYRWRRAYSVHRFPCPLATLAFCNLLKCTRPFSYITGCMRLYQETRAVQ